MQKSIVERAFRDAGWTQRVNGTWYGGHPEFAVVCARELAEKVRKVVKRFLEIAQVPIEQTELDFGGAGRKECLRALRDMNVHVVNRNVTKIFLNDNNLSRQDLEDDLLPVLKLNLRSVEHLDVSFNCLSDEDIANLQQKLPNVHFQNKKV